VLSAILTLSNSQHTLSLPSLLSLHQSSGTGFQQQTFPFLWVPGLSPCHSHSNSWLHSTQRHYASSTAHTTSSPFLSCSRIAFTFTNYVLIIVCPPTTELELYPTTTTELQSQSQSYITTDGHLASLSWCQAPIWDPRPIFLLLSLIIFRQLRVCWCGAPSLTRGWVCNLQCNDASSSYIVTDDLSASLSWSRAPNGAHDQVLIFFVWQLLSSLCRAPSPLSPMNRVIQSKVKVMLV
jgi:hypothetical protein